MKGYFFNAQPTADAVNHPSGYDRTYDALDFNRYMGAFFTNGVFVQGDADACKVSANGLRLTVKPGILAVNGGQCHFEQGDTIELAGAGKYSIMCRRDNSVDVRAFYLVAVKGDPFPAPVRSGDLYDMCLARVTATASGATVVDTRGDAALCGYAALTGQPAYYPPDSDSLPYVLWLYTMGFPMTAAQRTTVEGNPSLMAIFNASRTALSDKLKNALVQSSSGAALKTATGAAVTIPTSQLGYVVGSYTGNGASELSPTVRNVELGFTPSALLFWNYESSVDGGYTWRSEDVSVYAAKLLLQAQGHEIYQGSGIGKTFVASVKLSGTRIQVAGFFNRSGQKYNYIAFR